MRIQDALAAKDSKTVSVDCPEWGGTVYLSTMPADKYDEFEVRLSFARDKPERMKGIRAEFVAACWADENGVNAELTPKEIAGLKAKSPVVLRRIWDAAWELHQEIEDEVKN